MVRNLLLFIVIFQFSSCKWFTRIGSPFFSGTNIKIPDGTPTFQKGFKDGCSSSTYARGNVLYRNKYGYRYDPNMIGNSEYRFGHSRGYTWCFQQALSGDTGPVGSWDKYIHPGGYDSTFSSGNIEGAWGGFFGVHGASLGQSVGGDVGGFVGVLTNGGSSVHNANPLWAGGSSGQIFGQ